MNNPTPPHKSPRKKDRTHNIVIGQTINPDKMQRAKELRRQMTSEEKILWQQLRSNRLNGLHFRRQQIIDGCDLNDNLAKRSRNTSEALRTRYTSYLRHEL